MNQRPSASSRRRERLLCRKLLEPYCREVIRQRSRVQRGAGSDPVHELRVASRRLQEALDFLAPYLPEGPRKKLHRRARRIRRSLGELRNADVMVELASDLMRRLSPAERTVLRPFLSRLQTEAAGLRRRAIHRRAPPVPGVRKRIERLLKDLPNSSVKTLDSRGDEFLSERIHELSNELDCARRDGPTAMHRLRIAVKRYRYALEFLERAGRKELSGAIQETRRLQGELGHLHDLDVLLEILRKERPAPATRRLELRLRTERKNQIDKTRGVLADSQDLLARLSLQSQIRSAT
ncbi:MAG: CHAD domain-containing protein [Acidobacteria bacterium]|nr:CHAD domain-containing protein [Acidobacteriota bacterium]